MFLSLTLPLHKLSHTTFPNDILLRIHTKLAPRRQTPTARSNQSSGAHKVTPFAEIAVYFYTFDVATATRTHIVF
jgi:hypothetical protein